MLLICCLYVVVKAVSEPCAINHHLPRTLGTSRVQTNIVYVHIQNVTQKRKKEKEKEKKKKKNSAVMSLAGA